MNAIHYIGFDVHKKTISFCLKTAAGQIAEEGPLAAERTVLRRWAADRKRAWGNRDQTEMTLKETHWSKCQTTRFR
jgi:transposase